VEKKCKKKGSDMIEYNMIRKHCSILNPTKKKEIPCLFSDGTQRKSMHVFFYIRTTYSQTLQIITNYQTKQLTKKHHTLPPMASAQCNRTTQQTYQQNYQQKNQHPSFGQKVSELFKGHHNHPNEVKHTTQCSSQTKLHSHSGHPTTKTATQCSCNKTLTNTKTQDTTNKKGQKKGLVQNIKNRFSERDGSSSSSSESESDSESDNENCRKRKASNFYIKYYIGCVVV